MVRLDELHWEPANGVLGLAVGVGSASGFGSSSPFTPISIVKEAFRVMLPGFELHAAAAGVTACVSCGGGDASASGSARCWTWFVVRGGGLVGGGDQLCAGEESTGMDVGMWFSRRSLALFLFASKRVVSKCCLVL